MARLEEALRRAENELLVANGAQALTTESTTNVGLENIVGVGLSEKRVADRPTGEQAVAVYVVRKAAPDEVDPWAVVPSSYEGVPTEVIETGEFVACSVRERHRPTPLGVSIGHSIGNTGTLGFLAKHDGELHVVSNNHVFACENKAEKGDPILQPGVVDGGEEEDQIAELTDWVPLDFSGGHNPVDAAMASVDPRDVLGHPYEGGPLIPIPTRARRDATVRKCGRTSGLSYGVVADIDATIKLRYPSGDMALLSEQILIQGRNGDIFSEKGDSGSLVIDNSSNQPIGLVCGGSPRFTLANQIQLVLDGLGVSLAT